LHGRREDAVLLTKYTRTTERTAAPARTGNHRKAMLQSVHASLKRLQTDCIDFYFSHADDGVTPVEEIMRGFDDLVRQGKILFGGLSNFSAWRTAQAATLSGAKNWTPLSGIEVEYSLLQRTTEREIVPLARDLSLGVLGYSPLATGMLTGKRNHAGSKPCIPNWISNRGRCP
jgi:aryl-alcohol dehydrogenase-like predicted oxidoreductase